MAANDSAAGIPEFADVPAEGRGESPSWRDRPRAAPKPRGGEGGVVKSAARVLEILEVFGGERRPLTATEIQRRLDLPASSTFFLLKSLVSLGYLSFDADTRRYFPTLRVPLLGAWIDDPRITAHRIESVMRTLQEQTGETVTLACQNDLDMQVLHVISNRGVLSASCQPGMTAPIWGCATGWALLAHKHEAELARIVERSNRQLPEGTAPLDAGVLKRRINAAMQRHTVALFDSVIKGSGAIACMIPWARMSRPLALGVGGPSERIRDHQAFIIEKLLAARAALLQKQTPIAAIGENG
jgi:DNA-binding IclR family transcriptional regulator